MLKTFLAAAIGVTALIGGRVAMADAPVHPANNESGSVYHGATYEKADGRLVRADTWNTRAAARTAPKADDNWEYVGGETGWNLRNHRYDFVNGRLVHGDNLPHNTPKPVVDPARAPSGTFYPGG